MSNANINIVKNYIEQVINQKRLERLGEFCSDDCISHSSPYVGLGIYFDDTSGEGLIVAQIARNGPADGYLQIGDELVRAKNEERTWETFEELQKGLWARGMVGTEISLTVHRHGSILTIPLTLAQIDEFDIKVSDIYETGIPYLQQYWPDLRMDINQIFADGDMVACYAVDHGTNLEYNRSATWGEMDIFKLRNGKITDIWSVENTFDELKQLGYQISEPIRELA